MSGSIAHTVYIRYPFSIPRFAATIRDFSPSCFCALATASLTVSKVDHKELVHKLEWLISKDNGNLDKDETSGSTFDSFDSTRLKLKMFYTAGNVL